MPSILLASPLRAVPAQVQADREYLYSDDGRQIAMRSAAIFPKLKPITISDVFGGWRLAQRVDFVDGGSFDQIHQGK